MLANFYPIALALLRLFAGFMFWQHGAQKLLGLFGGPAAAPFTLPWVAGIAEFVGAIAIVLGFLTRPVSLILAVDMAILYLTRFLPEAFPPVLNRNGETAILLALIASLLVVRGPGKFSVDEAIGKRQSAMDLRLQEYYPAVLSVIRLVIGLLFLQHGLQKIFGLLNGEPYPFPQLRWFAGMIELFAGPALALGLFTRPIAFLVCGEMAFAYFINHNPRNFWPILNQGEWTVLYCYIFLFLVTAGPGKFSLDGTLWGKTERAQEPAVLRN
jgi:putative oxidoreductase